MKKIYIIAAFLVATLSFGQGLEDFTNSNATSGYNTNSFTGNNGITWSYIASRDANNDNNGSGIDLPALMLRRVSSNSKITSSTISGGIQDFSVKLYKGFTGSGGRQVELYINNILQGTSESFDDYNEHIFSLTNLNITGDITIEIRNTTSKQIIIDDISWTGFNVNCNVTLETANYSCTTNTIGDNNDGVTISIPYSGIDANITDVTTTSGGTLAGDNPAVTENGTITLSGLSEGDAWDIQLVGGDCAAINASGIVPANHCDPSLNTCFDISNGTENFEIFNAESSTVWEENNGTYSANGYCGSGCEIAVNGWLVFGPLDVTSVSGLLLKFDAYEDYSDTPLAINYTSNYDGCPSNTTWTNAQTLTGDDEGAIEIDLSAASGTAFYIGIQYLDDGIDGYSDWELSNIELATYGACPVLGTRTAADCSTLSTVETTADVFSIFPNPVTNGLVNITSKSNATITVNVFDILGKQVINQTVNNNTLNVSALNSGVYILKLEQNGNASTKKLVIK